MNRRIIGQCNTSDFKQLEYLSDAMARGIEVDFSTLTNKQRVAVQVLKHFQDRHVEFQILLKLKEVLVWDLSGGKMAFEYRLLNPRDVETRDILRSMY